MDIYTYKRAKSLQEETLPAFERLKKAISVGVLDDVAKKELAEALADTMVYENEFSDAIENFVKCWAEKYQEEFDNL